jgi:hypothetical protein
LAFRREISQRRAGFLPSGRIRVRRCAMEASETTKGPTMSKTPKSSAQGDSEAMRIYERMKEEEQRKAEAKEKAKAGKKVTLPRLKFMEDK